MPTKEELEIENNELLDENERLRDELAAAQAGKPSRPVPVEPSFGVSEGERLDLEISGVSVSPFTGKKTTREGAKK